MKNTSIFIAYSRKDKDYLNEMRSHLRSLVRRKIVQNIWYDGEIVAGEKWEAAIEQQLDAAKVILLLISSDFIASDYCHSKELKRALELHEAGEAIVIPVIVRDCYWRDEDFAALQIPNEGKAIASFPHLKDTFYANVVRAVRGALKNKSVAIEETGFKTKIIKTHRKVFETLQQRSKDKLIEFGLNVQQTYFPFEPEMVFVKGGVFTMGWVEGRDGEKIQNATPAHRIYVDDFWIGKYPVTNEEFATFLNDYRSDLVKDGKHKGALMIEEHPWGLQARGKWKSVKGFEAHPILNVTWYGATEYAKWLSTKAGLAYYLPSEAQWEYAARGGIESKGFLYAGSNSPEEVGWYNENSNDQTHPVGKKAANELEIYDMSGNLFEWCNNIEKYDGKDNSYSWFGNFLESQWEKIKGVDSSAFRGGSWNAEKLLCRIASRGAYQRNYVADSMGFRVVLYDIKHFLSLLSGL